MTLPSDINLTQFIKLKCHIPVLAKLDKAVERKRICTLLGPIGSGKTRLLDYWRRQRQREPHLPRANEILYIRLRSDKQLAVPTTCQLYSKLWHALDRLDRPLYLPAQSTNANEDEKQIKMYNARQLQELFPKFIEKAGRRNIRAVIVDDAPFLDGTAFDWLLDVRSYYHEQYGPRPVCAIILVGRGDTPAGKKLLQNIRDRNEAKAAWTDYDITIGHLSISDFFEAMSWVIPRNLHAEFAPNVNTQRESFELWKLAGGVRAKASDGGWIETAGARWWEFETIIEAFDDELGIWDGKHPRPLTNEIMSRVKQRLTKMNEP